MDELTKTYRDAMPSIEQIASQHDGVSGPLLISVPGSYSKTGVRLMIVGQQTYGWPSIAVGLDELLRAYEDFDLGREYTPSPFWQASHEVFRGANPNGPERAFLWTNLVRVDQHGERPCAEIEDAVSDLGLLNLELRLLEPHAVVFFTGPYYDERLRHTFPGVRYRELGPDVERLEHQDLPCKAFRTYHPRYLWQAKKRVAIDLIRKEIRVA